jgi:hypothetical protein
MLINKLAHDDHAIRKETQDDLKYLNKRFPWLNLKLISKEGHQCVSKSCVTEVPLKEYWHMRSMYSPELEVYLQAKMPGSKYVSGLTLIIFHEKAFLFEYIGTCSEEVKVYRVGCVHKMEHIARLGNCWNQYKCSKCGLVEQVDSSD